PKVRNSILRLIRGLDFGQQQILQFASTMVEPFGPCDVGAGAGSSPGVVLDALCGLVELGILSRRDGGFVFRVPVVRDVVASTVVGKPVHGGFEVAASAG
ncbi:MAG: hypothetical protein P8N02_06225, partial [Actinomycetota bacterium]|nr:hypothetical protein [Actinomycetota bacterium]